MSKKGWDIDLKFGEAGEKIVRNVLIKPHNYIEVKSDREISRTGNVAIEFSFNEEATGISLKDAEWWALLFHHEEGALIEYNSDIFVFMTRKRLQQICDKYGIIKSGGDYNASKMYIFPAYYLLYPLKNELLKKWRLPDCRNCKYKKQGFLFD